MPFDYWHRKQSGGRGEYARVIGYIEPLPAVSEMVPVISVGGEGAETHITSVGSVPTTTCR